MGGKFRGQAACLFMRCLSSSHDAPQREIKRPLNTLQLYKKKTQSSLLWGSDTYKDVSRLSTALVPPLLQSCQSFYRYKNNLTTETALVLAVIFKTDLFDL